MKKILITISFLILIFCLNAEDLKLDVMFTNDVHGGIDRYPATFMNPQFPPMLGGGGVAATYIKSVRQKSDKTRDNLLIDAGDFFQGHPIGTMSQGDYIIEYYNMISYDLMVIGNHEYDIGEEALLKTLQKAEFPILSCNIVRKGTDQLVDYVEPYIILKKMGVKIGVIGVTTTDTEQMSFPEHIKNVEFLSAKEQVEKYVKILREKEKVDLVFVVGHMGLPYEPQPVYEKRYNSGEERDEERRWGYDAQEIAHEVEGIDVLFGGHMHKGFNEPWEDPVTHTLVFQGYAYGSNVGHVTLNIDSETKTLSGYELPSIRNGALVTLFEDEFIPDPAIADTIAAMQAIAEEGMDEVIGEAAVYLSRSGNGPQNVIGNLVCEAMLDYTEADFAFLNLGGIRADIKEGPITYRDVFNVMPFDNQVVMMEVEGQFLKDIIEMRVSGSRHGLRVAGVKVVVNRSRENYDRVSELIIGGEPWQADTIYKVATTDFLLQGNAGLVMLTKVPEEKITRYEQDLRDAIVEFIKKESPVSTQIDDRWVRDDKSEKTQNTIIQMRKKDKIFK
ncbi:MAG: bifunctional metallophosphatase/5'-nucleotidase [Candidatus Cloacimonetes bacterium]|nr:bifunctional metallophosphatase/5'-nucleotidase [Candidatus Cloacimonadota bacterium]MCF7812911.1 bifunctional metallophosphatase/5'-nucleotidase [Candidatus Cloacimonadota bacterium]MCF7867123.1 bifunctional metallophosphatase/5'-nucleotidase [Candidatus Cloacimonadota bacterium]MCF7882557.1 bifunctional metallophosphatase/5'-nucleotidase [Candidatus Cloacimonadota bacterium]